MKKALKWGLIFIGFLLIFGWWYNWRYSMGVVENYSVNNANLEHKLLIATQQSEYKDKLTRHITDHFIGKEFHIQVIDVTQLDKTIIDEYDVFVIIHTYEIEMPPKPVRNLLSNETLKNKVFVVSTSGSGDLLPEGVDGVSSASLIINATNDAKKTIDWINNQFSKEI